MVSCGISTPHKLSVTTSSIPSTQNICKRSESLHCPSQVRQYFGSDIHQSERGSSLQAAVQLGNRNLGVVSDLQNHLGGRTPSWDSQHNHRPGVKNNSRSLRLDAKPINFSDHPGATGCTRVDLFASHLTKLLPWFYRWRPDPDAEATDAFTQNWDLSRGFANPPWCLINRCLCQVACQQARIVLLTLRWSTKSWFPVVLGMLEDHPAFFPTT